MNDKKGTLIILKMLDQILQDNQDAKNCIEKSITTICIEEVFLSNFLSSLSSVICNDMNSSLVVWRDSI